MPARNRSSAARRWTRRFLGLVMLVVFLAAGVAVGGFLRFADEVAGLEPPSSFEGTDAIVVLTGGYQRIDQAVGLLDSGIGERLLISGVNPRTTGAQIQKMTAGSENLFSCCVDIGHDAIDTIGNANETARWIRDNGYDRVLIVTNNYHVPRSLVELRRVDSQTDFLAYPVIHTDLKAMNWLERPEVARILIAEYAKYAVARLRALSGASTASGLRTDLAEPGQLVEVADPS